MKSKNTNGFTLVELIIVITILAILATIAFISFQGYTKDARNSKRESDLNSVSRSIEVKMANAVPVTSFVIPVAGVSNTGSTVAGIAGYAGSGGITSDQYKAGTIDFNLVGAKADDFKDPKGGDYTIASSTLAGGVYEIATTSYETDAGTGVKLIGNFKPRDTSDAAKVASIDGKVVTISSGLGFFKVGDTLYSNNNKIIGISNDLSKITLDKVDGINVGNYLRLYFREVKTLIGGTSLGY